MEDCYFYTTKKNGELYVVPLCIRCHDEIYPDLGWFWEGSKIGYGPYLFECEKCGKIIYEYKECED